MSGLVVQPGARQLQGPLLQRLDIVASALAELETRQTRQFFQEFATLLDHCLYQHYPLTPAMLGHQPRRWDWRRLSSSRALAWTDQLLDEQADQLDWLALSQNPALPWSAALIERHADRWHWPLLSDNPGLPWSSDLLRANA
ncbi:MAG: hypothetical protein RL342_1468, partial [Pseudomonadota bacterium]